MRDPHLIPWAGQQNALRHFLKQRVERFQQDAILIKKNRQRRGYLSEHVIKQAGVAVTIQERMQLGSISRANGFGGAKLRPSGTRIGHNDARIVIMAADGMQSNAEKIRRIEVSDAERHRTA